MLQCKHPILTLLPGPKSKKRCAHCHLIINTIELGDGYCPECYETHDEKRYDFTEVKTSEYKSKYRCEECGLIVDS